MVPGSLSRRTLAGVRIGSVWTNGSVRSTVCRPWCAAEDLGRGRSGASMVARWARAVLYDCAISWRAGDADEDDERPRPVEANLYGWRASDAVRRALWLDDTPSPLRRCAGRPAVLDGPANGSSRHARREHDHRPELDRRAEAESAAEMSAPPARESVAEYVRGAVRQRAEAASRSPGERHIAAAHVAVPAPTNASIRRAFARGGRRTS